MKPITVPFNEGIQFPPKLGTLTLKSTSKGKAAYAQNVDFSNDEYGNGAVVPGPALTTIGNNSELTGVPILRQFFASAAQSFGVLYFAQGVLGTKTIIRRIKDIISGSTPVIDTTGSMTANHASHDNQEIVDMVYRPASDGSNYIYVAGKDDTDTWVYKFQADTGSPSLSLVTGSGGDVVNANFTGGFTNQFLVVSSFDNNIYWIGKNRVSSIDTSDVYTVNKLALGLPLGSFASCAADWQQQLVIAFTNESFGDFGRRKSGGKSGVVVWDYISPGIIRNIPAPCRYISALIPAPDGSLLVFGGVDEGKTTIYTFTGYGFNFVTQYIGDMPRGRHSIDFDAQGRIIWQTVDGQFCRYDRLTGIFDHLASITTGSSAGGILAKGIGSPTGNEFFIASGSGSTYTMKKVQFGSYIGDGGGDDSVVTPQVASGLQVLDEGSSITAITLPLAGPLKAGERVELRVYKNGSLTDYETYLTMDYDEDEGITSKREVTTLDNLSSFNLVAVWKMADGASTVPAVLPAIVETESKY